MADVAQMRVNPLFRSEFGDDALAFGIEQEDDVAKLRPIHRTRL